MAHKNNLDPNFIKKMRQYYDVNPQPGFMPSLKRDLMDRFSAQQRTNPKNKPLRVALALAGTFAVLIIVFFTTPVYDVLGQVFVELFQNAESDVLPNYPGQTAIAEIAMAELNATKSPAPTDITSTPTDSPVEPIKTPEPSSMESANMTIEEVEQVAGFDVLTPAYLPEAEEFYGASYDPETNIVYLFYQIGLLIKQEPVTGVDDCDLCTEVGATARRTPVQIGDISGEFVIGVWELRDESKYWQNTPWLKRLRWESNNTVFEILYMGHPDTMTMDDLVEMAESLQ